MKRHLLAFFALVTLANTAVAAIEFTGVLTMSGNTLFALTETTAARTDWIALHGSFAGFVLTSYEQSTETLTLTRAGTTLRVTLKDDAKIKSARSGVTGTISFGAGDKTAIERATLLFDQENVFPQKDGITYRITPTRRADGTMLYRIVVDQKSVQAGVEHVRRVSAPSVVTLPDQRFDVRAGEYGFSFTPQKPSDSKQP